MWLWCFFKIMLMIETFVFGMGEISLLLGWSSPSPQASLLWMWGVWREALLKVSVCRWVLVAFHVYLKYWGGPAVMWLQVESIAETLSVVTWRLLGAKASGVAVATWLLQVLEKNNFRWPWWEYGDTEEDKAQLPALLWECWCLQKLNSSIQNSVQPPCV